ncbi:MAG TPA: DeoR/GlpR family DNA-binding transcription regulator [Streptosporangiaceae bacterium]|nr:DeoR/GlpR family DNA-binding transcription regulator [Streptosporangiaceae bacterium]
MLAEQRQNLIMAEIERGGGVRVGELAQLLGVSDMTVRRDIDALARRGLVRKVYGGATAGRRGTSDEPGFEVKSGQEKTAKEMIAATAAGLVPPGGTIAVSAGTTTYALAAHLAQVQDLTVVTNSVRVADHLFAHGVPSQTVLLTGGQRTPSDALVGPLAVTAMRGLHVDCLLMGVHGMDPLAGFTTPNLMEADVNRAMAASAASLVVLADHTKWGVTGLCAIAALADADVLVSDAGLGTAAREVIGATVGKLIIAGGEGPPAAPGPGSPAPAQSGGHPSRSR